MVLGHEIARELSLPLDIIVTRKITHPMNPEYAIGVVDENGTTIFNERESASVNKQWLKEEISKQKTEAGRRSVLYRKGKNQFDVEGKVVIIADDGIATGFTMCLAIRAVKSRVPRKIIIAVPVAPQESINELKGEEADEIIILENPEDFLGAVGAHYIEFDQINDEEVTRLLN